MTDSKFQHLRLYTYPRCALFDDPPSPLTVVQKAINQYGWRPATRGWHQRIWDARYAALCAVEHQIGVMETNPTQRP